MEAKAVKATPERIKRKIKQSYKIATIMVITIIKSRGLLLFLNNLRFILLIFPIWNNNFYLFKSKYLYYLTVPFIYPKVHFLTQ